MNKIKEMRKRENLSQVKLADKLNVSQGLISHWELGRHNPTTSELIKLAQIFNCTIDDLIKAEPPHNV